METKVSWKTIKELMMAVLDSSSSGPCKMMVLKLIQASNGLGRTVRAVIYTPDSCEMPPIVADYRHLQVSLNHQMKELGLPCQFRFSSDEDTYYFWLSHDGKTRGQDAEVEVGDFRGKNAGLAIRVNKSREPDETGQHRYLVSLHSSNDVEMRPSCYLPMEEALALVVQLHILMPWMRVSLTLSDDVLEDKVREAMIFLLMTNEEHDRKKPDN